MELIKIQLRSFRVVVILLLSVLFYFHLSLRKDLNAQSKIVQLSLRQSSNSSTKEIPELAPRDDVSSDCPSMMNGRGVPTFKRRNELGRIMQSEEFRIGVELGVQKGQYSQVILEDWYDCSEYHLVDLWEHQGENKLYLILVLVFNWWLLILTSCFVVLPKRIISMQQMPIKRNRTSFMKKL